ncbi:hypothetical protein HY468_05525 [Candidatus Roizmanbacteria bacterium]|nr:hypothetical protein [Candidatus Roizmanbacteria bacterium]
MFSPEVHLAESSLLFKQGSLDTGAFYTREAYLHATIPNLGGVVGRWCVEKLLGDEEKQGFPVLYQSRPMDPENVHNNNELHYQNELEITSMAIKSILELNQWERDSVDAVVFGNGMVMDAVPYMQDVARIAKLPERVVLVESGSYLFAHACNSSGAATHYTVKNEKLQGKRVIVLDVEHITRYLGMLDGKVADKLSLGVFSNGVAGLGFVPGKSLQYICGASHEKEDKKGVLPGEMAYKEYIDEQGLLIQQDEQVSYIRLPYPSPGHWIEMNGFDTGKLFLGLLEECIPSVLDSFKKYCPGEQIDRVVAHHASASMFKGVGRLLVKQGVLPKVGKNDPWETFPWVMYDGNASGATTLMAFVRQLNTMKSGDNILVVSFGAGASADVFVVKAGCQKNRNRF